MTLWSNNGTSQAVMRLISVDVKLENAFFFTNVEPNNLLYITTTLIGLLGGLIIILKLVISRCVRTWQRVFSFQIT